MSALILLLTGGAVTYVTIVDLLTAERWVAHTHEVQSALSNIEPVIGRAGRSRVGYVQTGDPIVLDEYQAALKETHLAVALVRQSTVDNPAQQSNCSRLEELVKERTRLMDRAIDLKRTGEATLLNEAQLTQSVVQSAAEMDALLRQMQDLEDRLLTERQTRSQVLFVHAVTIFAGTFMIAVFLLGLHYYLLNRELSARQQVEESLRHMSARLLEVQDAERRKISRELHDSLGQYLSGVKMSLEIVGKSIPPNALLTESVAILDQSIAETRTISHLLHPPLLDEVGFASAARWYVEGFAQRSGIHVDLTLPEKLGRLPDTVELALFRVLQEGLTNIHRHSESRNTEIALSLDANEVLLRIRDFGRGMAPDVLERFKNNSGYLGIGLVGMRERLREMGGRMEVQSNATGTQILAWLPIPKTRQHFPQPAL
ncbi:MAG: CHASE3 domain-containing protein [Candidatus Sulfotelmatobacter sp.]